MRVAVVFVLEEQLLVSEIHCESNSRYSQTRESAFKSVPSREGSRVSPGLSSLPGIITWLAGGMDELCSVEAGDVRLGVVVRSEYPCGIHSVKVLDVNGVQELQ